ncbi:MAG TPA: NAD(P)/FAD-dependent oxidoreductase [Myxococcaceae bacterium]|nr:NAD(P)/FAD-dependent oxidoreductase [Myxococcaceae bacterium]
MSGIAADVAVIGAGVVGLAVARSLARTGREVFVLEQERCVGFHTSSRNSEVVHAGLYYPPGSLKARLCVAGREALYAYCAQRGVTHRRTGKLVIATRDEEVPALERILGNAKASGVDDLRWIDADEIRALEPAVHGVRGLFSPSTGIVDSHGLMEALRADAEAAGAQVLLRTPVLSGRVEDGGVSLALGGDEPSTVGFRLVVNCAGPWAQTIARRIDGVPAGSVPPQRFARGHYFVLSGQVPFHHLVYPVPEPGGLGTHVTLDLAGRARFGPDVQWVDGVEYAFDEARVDAFYRSIRSYYPALADGALEPGYTGVRPKLSGPGEPAADFLVQGPAEHGVPGLVQLYGIESPGLTAVLALAEHVLPLTGA